MIEITRDSVVAGLKAIVEEAGEDFVYTEKVGAGGPQCVYVHNGKPDCIVGRYLASVGVPLERLAKADVERLGVGLTARDLVYRLQNEGVVQTNNAATDLLQVVQVRQDGSDTWGEALTYAIQNF